MQPTTAVADSTTRPTGTRWRVLRSPLIVTLGALLALQLIGALVLSVENNGLAPAASRGPLLAFDRDRVTGIRVAVPDAPPVLVARTDNGWGIPALGDLPAAERKVTELLSKLEGLEKGLPVATSEQALKRFKVAEDSFVRKLSLEGGDGDLASLYLGDSAGFRRLFVRADGDNSVYEAELGLFDAPDKADDWSDRTLLHLETEEVKRLKLADLTLERADEGWLLADLAEGEEQDPEATGNIINRLTNIDFLGVLGSQEQPEVDKDATAVEIEATLASGETVGYRIAKLAEGGGYLVEVSNRPQRFEVADYAAEELTGIGRADLLKETEQTDSTTPEAQEEDTGAETPAEPTDAQGASPDGSTTTTQPDTGVTSGDTGL